MILFDDLFKAAHPEASHEEPKLHGIKIRLSDSAMDKLKQYAREKSITPAALASTLVESCLSADGSHVNPRSAAARSRYLVLFANFKVSGLSLPKFANKTKVGVTTLRYWFRRFEDPTYRKFPRAVASTPEALERHREVIEEWKQSGMDLASFCRAKGLVYSQTWKYKKYFEVEAKKLNCLETQN